MEEFLTVVFVGFCVLFIAWITYHQLRIWRYRYFYSYGSEISEFLRKNELTLIESRYPSNLDWKDGCFTKPPSIRVSFSIIRINGISVTWTDKKYLIIDTRNSNGKGIKLWLEVETTYFQKPILTFKKARNRRKFFNSPRVAKSENITVVKGVCPACGWKLEGNETQCPECELHFQ